VAQIKAMLLEWGSMLHRNNEQLGKNNGNNNTIRVYVSMQVFLLLVYKEIQGFHSFVVG
jgi:hypothetical protein